MLLPAVPSAALGRWLLATASLAGRPSPLAHYAHADTEIAVSAAILVKVLRPVVVPPLGRSHNLGVVSPGCALGHKCLFAPAQACLCRPRKEGGERREHCINVR